MPVLPMLRWDDLNYDIIWDIFKHLPTLQQEACQRVSSAWNSILRDYLSKSFVIGLGSRDLAKWKLTFDLLQTPCGTRKAAREGRTRMVTEKTRCVIIDFANVKLTHCEDTLRASERSSNTADHLVQSSGSSL
ncbi:hypothetical protein RvY_06031 [Ramazzottius varieornatus]|uniref:F-box domain-containing protein n=1 Tax=Ramazzottius varieornatus TaxID=947166 RepID=A0A1D1V5Z3_RAMVA|nr:hypothetical protein RvY_06031 [Ramazzottius varieornatus]